MRFSLLATLVVTHTTSIAAFVTNTPQYMSPNNNKDQSSSSTTTSLQISALESLADITTLSIDSGDIDTVSRYAKTGLITDATTNPLFVSQAGANGDARYEVRTCCCVVHVMCAHLLLKLHLYELCISCALIYFYNCKEIKFMNT